MIDEHRTDNSEISGEQDSTADVIAAVALVAVFVAACIFWISAQ